MLDGRSTLNAPLESPIHGLGKERGPGLDGRLAGYINWGAQCKGKTRGPLFKNNQEIQDSDSRAFNQAQVPV